MPVLRWAAEARAPVSSLRAAAMSGGWGQPHGPARPHLRDVARLQKQIDDLLTPYEHETLALTGELVGRLHAIIGDGPTGDADRYEMVQAVHVVQKMILGQAAARAYPDLYRLLGGVVTSNP